MVDHVVTTQPGFGRTTTTVTTITQTGGSWTTNLFSICADKRVCLLGALCPLCQEMKLSYDYGESALLPLLPGSTFALRVGIREKYKIRGNAVDDWAAVYCCWPLALCQMVRELKLRNQEYIYHVSTAFECS
ncbi:PLAC8-like protein 1 [Erpetoichthys calabaricus]|uniref:PLAC8 like 1 n=1 Tax=Erpetoichthys calabaricus TaxID=27687 RepID=A0A8C4S7K5_ERPCA|nr:PLAC8-like protein 1 [Erpetoichthys calabaricus]